MTPADDRTSTAPLEPERPTATSGPAADAETGSVGTQSHSDIPSHLSQTSVLPVVPGFVLLAEVGRGGMGVVYRARDTALGRDVAVKILQHRYPPDGEAARRFVEESQITSQLQHPGIPPIHQVGTLADGRPFLAMKLIKGKTLDKLLKKRQTPAEDRGRFLAIFEQICQSVGYAHAHAIVHRDLKPANIMVGAFGEVQVMDWGLSKSIRDVQAVEGTSKVEETPRTAIGSLRDVGSATQSGSVMGTPAYMPPEQAGGEIAKIDARSDVFSLGAVLCVLLTGRPPYVGESAEAVQLMAIRAELGDALTRLDGCGAEPEMVALCKRCLSVKREDRPADANELAAVVAAFRTAAEERARQAELDRVRAEGERAKAEAETREQRKRRKVQLALAAAVAMLIAAGGSFAWYSDRQANEQKRKDELAEADLKAERERAEGERKASEAKLKGEADAERRFKAEQARQGVKANLSLATDLRKQYKFKAADTALVQAAAMALGGAPELLSDVEQARSDLAFAVKLDDIRFRKWIWLAEPGGKGDFNTKIAAPEYRQAFAEHKLDLEKLAPTEAAARIAASAVKSELVAAVDDWALYEPDAAVRNRLLEITRKADPGTWTDRLRNPAVWSNEAAIQKLAAEADPGTTSPAALSVLAELMARRRLDPAPLLIAARAKHPSDFELAFALGQCYSDGKGGRGIGPYEAARALRSDNSTVWNNMGDALSINGDLVGAVAAYNEAIRLSPKDAAPFYNLGNGLRDKGDPLGSIAAYKEAIRLDPRLAKAYTNLGGVLLSKGDPEGAIAAYKEVIRIDPNYAKAHFNLGHALSQKGDLVRAIAAYKEAIRLEREYAPAHYDLGLALYRKGDLPGSIAAYKEAIRLNPEYARAIYNLGVALMQAGDLEGAIAAYREAIRLDSRDAKAHTNLALIYLDQKKYPEAIACARAAIKAAPNLPNPHALLGSALQRSGDIPGARAALTEASRLDKRFAPMLAKLPTVPVAPPPRAVERP